MLMLTPSIIMAMMMMMIIIIIHSKFTVEMLHL